jgi:hypothetical protein
MKEQVLGLYLNWTLKLKINHAGSYVCGIHAAWTCYTAIRVKVVFHGLVIMHPVCDPAVVLKIEITEVPSASESPPNSESVVYTSVYIHTLFPLFQENLTSFLPQCCCKNM